MGPLKDLENNADDFFFYRNYFQRAPDHLGLLKALLPSPIYRGPHRSGEIEI